MAAIPLRRWLELMHFLEWKFFYFDPNFIEVSVLPKGPIDDKSALVLLMASYLIIPELVYLS